MASLIDRALWFLKWPCALFSLLLLPGAVWAWKVPLTSASDDIMPVVALSTGFVIYAIAWYVLLRRPSVGSWLSVLEHEMTHALFAILTFHRVTGLRTSWRDGGHMTYLGRGNWLISIAPYFFPTISVMVAAVLFALPESWLTWTIGLLGVTIAYHVTSTYREIHRAQEDLKKVGFPFAFAFLPAANVLWYGVVLSFACGAGEGLGDYLTAAWDVTRSIVGAVL
jgi:hypothetical protein